MRAAIAKEALIPCPFCGSDLVSASMGEYGDGSPWRYVECESCGASTEPDVWNRRAPQPSEPPAPQAEAPAYLTGSQPLPPIGMAVRYEMFDYPDGCQRPRWVAAAPPAPKGLTDARKTFENWIDAQKFFPDGAGRFPETGTFAGEYLDESCQDMWLSWQAAILAHTSPAKGNS